MRDQSLDNLIAGRQAGTSGYWNTKSSASPFCKVSRRAQSFGESLRLQKQHARRELALLVRQTPDLLLAFSGTGCREERVFGVFHLVGDGRRFLERALKAACNCSCCESFNVKTNVTSSRALCSLAWPSKLLVVFAPGVGVLSAADCGASDLPWARTSAGQSASRVAANSNLIDEIQNGEIQNGEIQNGCARLVIDRSSSFQLFLLHSSKGGPALLDHGAVSSTGPRPFSGTGALPRKTPRRGLGEIICTSLKPACSSIALQAATFGNQKQVGSLLGFSGGPLVMPNG